MRKIVLLFDFFILFSFLFIYSWVAINGVVGNCWVGKVRKGIFFLFLVSFGKKSHIEFKMSFNDESEVRDKGKL